MRTPAQAFAKILRERRADLQMNQHELFARTNITTMTLSKYENGHVTPNLERAVAIAQALGFTLNDVWEAIFEPDEVKPTPLYEMFPLELPKAKVSV